jgi:rhodanese-related sulfurtransferase
MVTDINRQTLLELIDAGAQIVDVLPEREFNSGHIPGAVSIPLKTLTAETVSIPRACSSVFSFCKRRNALSRANLPNRYGSTATDAAADGGYNYPHRPPNSEVAR